MNAVLLVAMTTMSLAIPSRADNAVCQNGIAAKVQLARQKAGQVVGRLRGRVLGSFIRSGMTQKQVDEALQSDSYRLESGGVISATVVRYWRYYTHGLTVSFRSDKDGVIRVNNVAFWPLFD
jgi:hypothetical protein